MATGTQIAKAAGGPSWLSGGGRLAWFCLLWSFWVLPGWSAEPINREYQLKAAFLYNFTKFVDWPTNRLIKKDEPLIIGVLGDNPFGNELAKAVEGRTQNGHAFLVTNLTAASEMPGVHLLFVPRGQEAVLREQGAALLAAGVLTVGESEAAAKLGEAITFSTEADKIRFEINLDAAEQNGFKVSSKLLQLAKVVRTKPQPGPS
jgi:hypothetical protein